MTPRCICIKMAVMDKKQGAPTEKGLPRHASAAMRVTHTTIQGQLGHHLSSQHPLFDGPYSEEAVARTIRIAFGRIPLKLQTNPSPLSEHSLHARNCILGSSCGCDSGHCDSGSVCSNSGSTNALPRPADGAQDSGLTQKLAQSH
uniref:HDC13008 n=1 Tax=Drosophila melanogaster TaxID=7227 RepID=Q6IKA6_DROME|nr:TPA_inf: HDC13008 [Drosophila melanogaster]